MTTPTTLSATDIVQAFTDAHALSVDDGHVCCGSPDHGMMPLTYDRITAFIWREMHIAPSRAAVANAYHTLVSLARTA